MEPPCLDSFAHLTTWDRTLAYDAPGLPFIFGFQDPEIRYKLASDGHLSTDPLQNTRYLELASENYNAKATLEPIKDFRISLDFQQRKSRTLSSNFRFDTSDGFNDFIDLGLQETGMFTTTFFTWPMAFDKMDNTTYQSEAFSNFKDFRITIAERLQQRELTEGVNAKFADSVGIV